MQTTTLMWNSAYADTKFEARLAAQGLHLHNPRKKAKGKRLIALEKYHNRYVSRLRQPVEGLFHWFNANTGIQDANGTL